MLIFSIFKKEIPQTITLQKNPLNSNYFYSKDLQQLLVGKQLLPDEIPFSQSLLDEHFQNGYIGYYQGVIDRYCNRCGNQDKSLFYQFPCARCGKTCTYCRKCIMMGRVQECSNLYTWTGPETTFSKQEQPLFWNGILSDPQQLASQQVVEAVRNPKTLLVWAVCGAGKTEVLFHGIAAAITLGKRVCITTPRTDVILELAPRLKKAFPHTSIAVLYGGSEERHVLAQLVLSTTHQLLRFYQAFDVTIIDEVDAFPYTADTSLQFAVQKARKPESTHILLTATPSKQLQKQAKSGQLPYVMIPARFHRKPIPVPKLKWCGNWKKSIEEKVIPTTIWRWVKQRVDSATPYLLFFPNIDLMEQALPLLQKIDPQLQSVHAEDIQRKEKVQSLREGKVLGLLTTSILERGVTIPRLDVAVLGAEEAIFTESALVQIAGRVGRKADFPTGDITIFHYGRTYEMEGAVYHIQNMNHEAKKRGLLDG
ncbi:DEAD/DEAH box helicase [Peribacillus alkalitolerans]|uniref:DEAD/DEAH box helicase n=1 Tax=Peribacillus alkalitolerans TaxID=1550385 RepID=UPI0023DDF4D9|nr:DEAD/DEAH box helicase [Peribacillus alkalitolerans]